MRDAALIIAAQRQDFAPSLATRLLSGLKAFGQALARRRRARADLARLAEFDSYMLADLGLTPTDLREIGPGADPFEASRRLAAAAERRNEERWQTRR